MEKNFDWNQFSEFILTVQRGRRKIENNNNSNLKKTLGIQYPCKKKKVSTYQTNILLSKKYEYTHFAVQKG